MRVDSKDYRAAFPHGADASGQTPVPASKGMTLRDYFAAKAMQAYLTNDRVLKDLGQVREDGQSSEDLVAQLAYVMADAMMARKTA